MSSQNSNQLFAEIKTDFVISWQALKENWKAFIGTEIFGFVALIVTTLATGLVLILLSFVLTSSFPNFFDLEPRRSNFFLTFFGLMLFFAFLSCQYGLAYDIMSSGDMFAEFKGAFTYFRRHWFHYIILTFLVGWIQTLFHPETLVLQILIRRWVVPLGSIDILYGVLLLISRFLWFVVFINALPSITAQGSFKQSFIENYRILRKHPKRLVITWGIFFCIFSIPSFILSVIEIMFFDQLINSIWGLLLTILVVTSSLVGILLGTPMTALIATRMYNSVEFDRYNPPKHFKEVDKNLQMSKK
ncbi:MAG: hypothetical protein ACFFBD_02875 [Candidatus Hodarchaeota archaeon]